MNDKQIAKLLSRFKQNGYDKVSLSELLYYVKDAVYVKDVIASIKQHGYTTVKYNGETFVILRDQKLLKAKSSEAQFLKTPSQVRYCALPKLPSFVDII